MQGPISSPDIAAPRRLGTLATDAAPGHHGARGGTWKLLYTDTNGVVQEIALGAAGAYLKSTGTAAAPTMAVIAPTDLTGGNWKIFYSNGSGVVTELALGAANTYLKSNGASSAPTMEAITVALKTSGSGYFCIPAGPSTGTIVASSGTTNTYGSWVQMIASTAAALYIVGVAIYEADTGSARAYCQLNIGTGAGASEVSIGVVKSFGTSDTSANGAQSGGMIALPFPIPVANATRIACQTADGVTGTGANWFVTLICIAQADLVAIT